MVNSAVVSLYFKIPIFVIIGCDSVSAFYGKGKAKSLKTMECKDSFLSAFGDLGCNYRVSISTRNLLEHFVCRLYGSTKIAVDDIDVNLERFKIFKKVEDLLRNFYPNRDSLQLHIDRSNYQS